MRRLVPLLLAVLPLGFATAPFLPKTGAAAQAHLKALQGEWILHTYHHKGVSHEVKEAPSDL